MRRREIGHDTLTIWQTAGLHGLPFSVPVSVPGKYQNKYFHVEVGVDVFSAVTPDSFTCLSDSLLIYWHMVIGCIVPIENINDYMKKFLYIGKQKSLLYKNNLSGIWIILYMLLFYICSVVVISNLKQINQILWIPPGSSSHHLLMRLLQHSFNQHLSSSPMQTLCWLWSTQNHDYPCNHSSTLPMFKMLSGSLLPIWY